VVAEIGANSTTSPALEPSAELDALGIAEGSLGVALKSGFGGVCANTCPKKAPTTSNDESNSAVRRRQIIGFSIFATICCCVDEC
jgi:hypothetical protein